MSTTAGSATGTPVADDHQQGNGHCSQPGELWEPSDSKPASDIDCFGHRDAPSDTRPRTRFNLPALPCPWAHLSDDRPVTTVGYVWVSTVDHSLDIQLDAFNAADCTHVFTDTASVPLTHAPAPPLPSLALDAAGLAVLAVAPPVRTMRP